MNLWNAITGTLTGRARGRLPRAVRALILLIAFPGDPEAAAPQQDGDPLVLGHYRVLHSAVLEEDRILQLHLPTGYAEADIAYPAVYLFYSDQVEEYFAQAVHELSALGTDRMPQTILVGIPNTQRYRDLLAWPQEGRPGTGQAERFLRFVREELIPFVDKEYRTKAYRILVGPQAAAVFGAYAFVNQPGLFQAYVLNDPCRQDGPGRSLCRDVLARAVTPGGGGAYFAVSHQEGETRWSPEPLLQLAAGLEAAGPGRFRWRIHISPDWPLFLPPLEIRESLLDLFSGYTLDLDAGTPDLPRIQAHFESLSRRYGFTVDPPDHLMAAASDRLMAAGAFQEAEEVLDHLVLLHPSSLDGPWRLANLHRLVGDTASAIRYYRECLRRDPDLAPARDWLERLGGGSPRPAPSLQRPPPRPMG